ncbi:MAG: septation regulator SpoVG [Candidatus Eisenbacteria bacterium]|nr:septation regulator SpoVG [Candidatus Eisenbacteria bacterium]
MQITEVRITLREDQKLRAFASITFDNCFVVRGLKVIEGSDHKMFVAMPSKKKTDGTYEDIAHPINNECRRDLEDAVLGAYRKEKAKQHSLIGSG